MTPYEKKRMYAWQKAGIKIDSYGQYVELYEKAGGKCEVCESPLSLGNEPEHATAQLDHDHETGEMRGILCSIHNYDIWKIERYHPDELRGLAKYLLERIANHSMPSESISGDLRHPNDHEGIITPERKKKSKNGKAKK